MIIVTVRLITATNINSLLVTSQVLPMLYLSESPQHLQSHLPHFAEEETKAETGLSD